jgi:predicted nucleotidyltransferase
VVLADPVGQLSSIVEALGLVVDRFRSERYALVGGLAVFCRVGAQRVTSDVDTAVAMTPDRARSLVAEVATHVPGRQPSFALPNGVVVDLLFADPAGRPPRRGIGRLREARGAAATYAISSADDLLLGTEPVAPSGDIAVRVAAVPALIAMKLVARADPARPLEKRRSDLHDLWRLLASRPDETGDQLRRLVHEAPTRLTEWVAQELMATLGNGPDTLARQLRGLPGAPQGPDEVENLWEALVAPALTAGE